MSSSSAVTKVNWSSLASKLKPETLGALNAFRRQHSDLAKKLQDLRDLPTSLDLSPYQAALSNAKVLHEASKTLSAFKPASYNLKDRLDFIQKQESKAVYFPFLFIFFFFF